MDKRAMSIDLRPTEECEFDFVSLGEAMIRLSPPGHGRVEFATTFEVFVGGAEYNVAHALARFGLRSSWIGGLTDDPLGRLVSNHARAAGVDLSSVVVRQRSATGRSARMGLHFAEVGIGPRLGMSHYDRWPSATSELKVEDVDWFDLFHRRGVKWFHTGGVFTALSASCLAVAEKAMRTAREAGTIVSFDLNFRPALWDSKGAIAATRPLVPYIGCLIGNPSHLATVLGYRRSHDTATTGQSGMHDEEATLRSLVDDYPNLLIVASTLRSEVSATEHGWSAFAYESALDLFHRGPEMIRMVVEDRIGGGDGFASGIVYGLLAGRELGPAVLLGVAHGALVQTTRGDTSQIGLDEVEQLASTFAARDASVDRPG